MPDADGAVGTMSKGMVLGNQGSDSPTVVPGSILSPSPVQGPGQGPGQESMGIALLLGAVLDSNQHARGWDLWLLLHTASMNTSTTASVTESFILLYRLRVRLHDPVCIGNDTCIALVADEPAL